MIERKCRCGGELCVEVPPFSEMSQQDIDDWRNSGGRVMVCCKECGTEQKDECPNCKAMNERIDSLFTEDKMRWIISEGKVTALLRLRELLKSLKSQEAKET